MKLFCLSQFDPYVTVADALRIIRERIPDPPQAEKGK